MSDPGAPSDPFEFLRKFWAPLGLPMAGAGGTFGPGMMFPTTNVQELERRIADLRSVEGWLTLNLEMVRTTIQGMEAQKATLAAFQSMQAQAAASFSAATAPRAAPEPAPEGATASRRPRRKKGL
jgi:hypothetical protein